MISIRNCYVIAVAIVSCAACGSSIEKGPKKQQPSNNGATNNGATNNGATNNGATNNGATNNGATNNGATNNGVTNNMEPCLAVPDSLDFGSVTVGNSATRFLDLENCGPTPVSIADISTSDGFFVIETPPMMLQPGASATGTVEFAPSVVGSATGQLTMSTSMGPVTVGLSGTGEEVGTGTCAESVARVRESSTSTTSSYRAEPGETVQLTAGQSSAGSSPITGYEWTIVQRPAGSGARLAPNATVVDPTITVDVAGMYQVEVLARSTPQPSNCPPGRVTIEVREADPEAIQIQLTWDTPLDADQTDTDGTDLDLHYMDSLGQWNLSPFDVFWQNPSADWGAKGEASVDIDDIDGQGPETISHRFTTTGLFRIGVYYYSRGVFDSFGTSTARVKLFRGTTLLADRSKALINQTDFWQVVTLDVANDAVTNVDTVGLGFP